jgi:hypothetical protein
MPWPKFFKKFEKSRGVKKPRQLPGGANEVHNLKEKAMELAASSLRQSPK